MNDPGDGYVGDMIRGTAKLGPRMGDSARNRRRLGIPVGPSDDVPGLKELIGAAEARREAGQRKKAASRIRGRKAKARKRERIAAASRKRNRR